MRWATRREHGGPTGAAAWVAEFGVRAGGEVPAFAVVARLSSLADGSRVSAAARRLRRRLSIYSLKLRSTFSFSVRSTSAFDPRSTSPVDLRYAFKPSFTSAAPGPNGSSIADGRDR